MLNAMHIMHHNDLDAEDDNILIKLNWGLGQT